MNTINEQVFTVVNASAYLHKIGMIPHYFLQVLILITKGLNFMIYSRSNSSYKIYTRS